jgi:hypothetical protein
MSRSRFTETFVKGLKPPAKGARWEWDSELTGFLLRIFAPTKVHPKGARTFYLSYWLRGGERRYRIGSWPDWSVTAARAEAKAIRQRVDRGEDPATVRRELRDAPTMQDLWERVTEPSTCRARRRSRNAKTPEWPSDTSCRISVRAAVSTLIAKSGGGRLLGEHFGKLGELLELAIDRLDARFGFDNLRLHCLAGALDSRLDADAHRVEVACGDAFIGDKLPLEPLHVGGAGRDGSVEAAFQRAEQFTHGVERRRRVREATLKSTERFISANGAAPFWSTASLDCAPVSRLQYLASVTDRGDCLTPSIILRSTVMQTMQHGAPIGRPSVPVTSSSLAPRAKRPAISMLKGGSRLTAQSP